MADENVIKSAINTWCLDPRICIWYNWDGWSEEGVFCPVLVCLFVFVKSRVSFQLWQAPGCDVPDSMKLSKYTLNSMQKRIPMRMCVYR